MTPSELQELSNIVKESLGAETIHILDDSARHQTHLSFQEKKAYLIIQIKCSSFEQLRPHSTAQKGLPDCIQTLPLPNTRTQY